MASSPQPRNRLGKGGGKNNEMPKHMWKKKAGGKEKGSKEGRER